MSRQHVSVGPSIYQRGDGRWMATIQIDGVRKSVYVAMSGSGGLAPH